MAVLGLSGAVCAGRSVVVHAGAIELTVKPRVCVISDSDTLCEAALAISWQAPSESNVCLWREDASAPLKCWNKALNGEHALTLQTSKSVSFSLEEQSTKRVLGTTLFNVTHNHKRFRRARRNAWSFF